jgi:dolichol-phosphate mannosyltransferase
MKKGLPVMAQITDPKPKYAEQPSPSLETVSDSHAKPFHNTLEPLLTIVVPVYNEANTIDELLRRVVAAPCVRNNIEQPSPPAPLPTKLRSVPGEGSKWEFFKQVIVVDDGSTDGTGGAVEKWRDNPQVELFSHAVNRGKGAAIRTGLAHARGRFIIVQDADLEYDPAEYPLLIEPLLSGKAQVVYGSRYLIRKPLKINSVRWLRWGVSVLNFSVRLLYGARLTDEATCYKAFSTELLKKLDLQCERFEFCPEVTAKICRLGITIQEVPISYESRNVRAGKKLRWTDGVEALETLWKYRHWKK